MILVVVLLLGTLWGYSNWYYNLNSLFPFNDLANKVAIDGIDIIEFSERADLDEIYLVDTVSKSIRQLTNDNYRDEHPNISFSNNRIYFVSNRFLDRDQPYGKSHSSIYFYDLTENEIYPAYPTLRNMLSDSTSDIKDLIIHNDLISFIEYHDGMNQLKIGRIGSNELISQYPVNQLSGIMKITDTQLTFKEMGELRTLNIN